MISQLPLPLTATAPPGVLLPVPVQSGAAGKVRVKSVADALAATAFAAVLLAHLSSRKAMAAETTAAAARAIALAAAALAAAARAVVPERRGGRGRW